MSRAIRLWCALVAVLALLGTSGCSSATAVSTPAPELTPGPGAFAARCSKAEDCTSLLCVRLDPGDGLCTRACETNADCPSASNWGCVSTDDDMSVCACRPDPSRVCGDGLDNDCDGIVDPCQTCGGVDVSVNDPLNCGSCGNACGAGQTCTNGECVCSSSGQTACGESCVDTSTDPTNCGACGFTCPAEQTCVEGVCGCANPAEPDRCGDTCTSLQTDPANCGTCGDACAAPRTCESGACTCPASVPVDCNGTCVDTTTDASNCGACGHACGSGQTCAAGVCTCTNAAFTTCGTECVDTAGDASNCGGCGHACSANEACVASSCTCQSGVVCSGACEALGDPSNCGACGHVCPQGQSCSGLACVCPNNQTACGASCVDTETNTADCGSCGHACPGDQTCTGGTCGCATGTTWCASTSTCANTSTDVDNCGSCGHVCPSAEVCSSGTCACATSGDTYCSSTNTCVSTSTDVDNCGSCGHVCPSTEVCTSGSCACPSGDTLCGSTCVNTSSDANNCGACGKTCPTSGSFCEFGECYCTTAGLSYCAGTNSCVNTQTDSANCGGCGHACPSGSVCQSGACTCTTSGLTFCGSSCVDLQTDTSDCGQCGNPCGTGELCAAGQCRCPAPVVGSKVTLTTGTTPSTFPQIASNGTSAAVFFVQGQNVHVAFLNADGTRAIASDTVLTSFGPSSTSSVWPGSIVATGTGWAVVWEELSTPAGNSGPDGEMYFQAIGANGAVVGSPVDLGASISNAFPSNDEVVRLAYDASEGFAIVWSDGDGTFFQTLGADGAHPGSASGYGPEAYPGLAAKPSSGGWGAIAAGQLFDQFSSTGVMSSTEFQISDPQSGEFDGLDTAPIVYDGASWVVAYPEHTTLASGPDAGSVLTDVYVARGPSFGTSMRIGMVGGAPGSFPFGNVALAASGSDVVVAWENDGSLAGPYGAMLARYRAPSDPTAAFVTLSDPSTLEQTSTIDGTSLGIAAVGPTGLLAVWADKSTGTDQITVAPVSFGSCE